MNTTSITTLPTSLRETARLVALANRQRLLNAEADRRVLAEAVVQTLKQVV